MVTGHELYRPWMISGTVFNKMLQCSLDSNQWLEHALTYCLPYEVLECVAPMKACISVIS